MFQNPPVQAERAKSRRQLKARILLFISFCFFMIFQDIFHDISRFPWFSRIFMIPYVWLITYCFSWFSMTTGIFAQFLLICLYTWCTWIHVQEENGLFITGWDSSKWVQMDVSTIEAKTSSSKIDGLGNQFSSCHVFNISSLIFVRMDDIEIRKGLSDPGQDSSRCCNGCVPYLREACQHVKHLWNTASAIVALR